MLIAGDVTQTIYGTLSGLWHGRVVHVHVVHPHHCNVIMTIPSTRLLAEESLADELHSNTVGANKDEATSMSRLQTVPSRPMRTYQTQTRCCI